jgi:transcriptional regulator GlxA family with amidase domain
MPLADIAATSGFADQAHLTRTLRAATGAPPSRLRQQIKSVQDAARATALQ